MTLLKYFRTNPRPKLKKEQYFSFLEESEKKFYDKKRYEWIPSKCYSYVKENNLDLKIFIDDLNIIAEEYSKNYKTRIGFENLIKKLLKSKRLDNPIYSTNGFPLKKEIKIVEFLSIMKHIKDNYLSNVSNQKWIKFINKSFNTNYSENTLLQYHENRTTKPKELK